MKIVSEAINGGSIPDRYGKRGKCNENGMPILSVPFTVEDAPVGTESFAFVLDDIDSVPVCGFVWIHWLGANIMTNKVEEGASTGQPDFVQGTNSSYGSNGKKSAFGYVGMAPPDAPHQYTLRVYALDCRLELENGFFYNELIHAMEGHILETASVSGIYNN